MNILNGKKRFAAAALVAAGLGGGAFAYANTLTPTSQTLGAGSVGVNSPGCNPQASYTTTWDSANQRFDVKQIIVTDHSGDTSGTYACGTDTVQVQLQQGSSPYTDLGTSPTAAPLSSHSVTFDVTSQNLDASLVTHVAVAVTGAS